jgi:hypothetical protein
VAFIPNIPSSQARYSELDKAMTVAKHKGASVAGGRRQVNVAVGRDRRMVAALPVRALNGDDVEAVT